MASDDRIEVQLAAKIDDLQKGFAEADASVRASMEKIVAAVEGGMERASSKTKEKSEEIELSLGGIKEAIEGAEKSFSRLSEFLLAGLGVEKLIDLGKEAAETGEQIEKASSVTGMSVEKVQQLGYAANLAGVGTQQLDQGLMKLSRSMLEAQQGSSKAVDAFAAVGLKASDLKNMSPDQVMSKIAEAFSRTADGATKDAVAFELFGRSAAEMIPFLDKGTESMQELADEAQKLGIVLSDQQVKALAAANEKFKELGAVTSAAKTQIGAELVPAFVKIAQVMEESLQSGMPLREFFSGLGDVMLYIARAGLEVAFTLETTGKDIAALAAMANRAIHGDIAGIKAVHTEIVAEEQQIKASFDKLRATLSAPVVMPKVENPNEGAPQGQLHLPNSEAAAQAIKDQFSAQNAAFKAEQAMIVEKLKEEQKANEDSFKAGKIGVQQYWDERNDITLRGLNQEIAAITRQVTETEALKAKAGPKEQGALYVKLIELNGQLAVAEQKRNNAAIDGAGSLNVALKQQAEQIGQIQMKAAEEDAKAQIAAQQKVLEAKKEMNQISNAQFVAAEIQLQNQLLAIDKAALEQQKALLGPGKLVQQAQIDAQLQTLETQHQAKILEIQTQAQQQQMALARETYNSVANDFQQVVAKFIGGGEKMGSAWQQFARLFDQSIDQMFAKLLTQSIFGGGGTGPGLFGGLFGGGGGGSGGSSGGLLGGLFKSLLGSSGGLGSLFGGAGGTAASAAASTDASFGMGSSALTSAFSFAPLAGGLAQGGYAAPGAMYEVAENGPETLQVGGRTFLMMGAHGGMVNPSGGGSGTGHTFNVTNRFTSNQPMDGRSQSQMAAAAHRGVTRAASRQ